MAGSCDGINSPAASCNRRSQVSHSPTWHCDFRQSNSQMASPAGTSSTTCRQSHPQAERTNFIYPPRLTSYAHSSTDAVRYAIPLASSMRQRQKRRPLPRLGCEAPPRRFELVARDEAGVERHAAAIPSGVRVALSGESIGATGTPPKAPAPVSTDRREIECLPAAPLRHVGNAQSAIPLFSHCIQELCSRRLSTRPVRLSGERTSATRPPDSRCRIARARNGSRTRSTIVSVLRRDRQSAAGRDPRHREAPATP
jgi:hypothetical protein